LLRNPNRGGQILALEPHNDDDYLYVYIYTRLLRHLWKGLSSFVLDRITSPHIIIDQIISSQFSPNIIRQIKSRRMRWAGHVAWMGEKWKVYRVLVVKPEGKRPLGR
jgi:hypothetical protein